MDRSVPRFEHKYLVPTERLADLRDALRPFVRSDVFAERPSEDYTVHSIYLDNSGLACYYEKESGIRRRRKARIRGYNQRDARSRAFLEVKRKDGDAVSKSRAGLPFSDVDELLATGDTSRHFGNQGTEAESDARAFLYHVYRYSMRPVVLTRYEREAYHGKHGPPIRVTIDRGLRGVAFPRIADLFDDGGAKPTLRGYVVLEAKFAVMAPWWFGGLLEDFGLERVSVSKYAVCLDSHELPARATRHRTFVASGLVSPRHRARGAVQL